MLDGRRFTTHWRDLERLDARVRDAPAERGNQLLRALFSGGLVVRMLADTVILAPALVAEREHIDQICDTLRGALRAL